MSAENVTSGRISENRQSVRYGKLKLHISNSDNHDAYTSSRPLFPIVDRNWGEHGTSYVNQTPFPDGLGIWIIVSI